jgi:hypothetical protein
VGGGEARIGYKSLFSSGTPGIQVSDLPGLFSFLDEREKGNNCFEQKTNGFAARWGSRHYRGK